MICFFFVCAYYSVTLNFMDTKMSEIEIVKFKGAENNGIYSIVFFDIWNIIINNYIQ